SKRLNAARRSGGGASGSNATGLVRSTTGQSSRSPSAAIAGSSVHGGFGPPSFTSSPHPLRRREESMKARRIRSFCGFIGTSGVPLARLCLRLKRRDEGLDQFGKLDGILLGTTRAPPVNPSQS